MCRLLGWVAPRPMTLSRLLGDDLDAFTRLAVKHGDGWGVATPRADGVDVVKAPDSARTSPRFAALARDHEVDAAMVHLRWATLGLPVEPGNTHPFTDGRIAFAHNGSISPPSSLDPLVAPDLLAARAGTTDSERYFLALRTRLRTSPGPLEALGATVRDISALHHSSLNAMLITPETLYAVCRWQEAAEAAEEEEDYYRLHYRVQDGAVVVASSGFGSGWQHVADGEVLEVARATGEVRVHAVHDLAQAA